MTGNESRASEETTEERHRRGGEGGVIRKLNAGEPQPVLEGMREEFPFLADAIAGYALGDVWARPILDDRTRQIAAVAAFAALGMPDLMRVPAGYALNAGVSEEELKEVAYLTTVPAGFGRAIGAAQTLGRLFAERRSVMRGGGTLSAPPSGDVGRPPIPANALAQSQRRRLNILENRLHPARWFAHLKIPLPRLVDIVVE